MAGCAPGFFWTVGGAGAMDSCNVCDAVANAVAVTCTEAGNSRATACQAGFVREDNSGAAASDVCNVDAGGR